MAIDTRMRAYRQCDASAAQVRETPARRAEKSCFFSRRHHLHTDTVGPLSTCTSKPLSLRAIPSRGEQSPDVISEAGLSVASSRCRGGEAEEEVAGRVRFARQLHRAR
eukprot:28460-Pelagococcus_subviridis.AAC.1